MSLRSFEIQPRFCFNNKKWGRWLLQRQQWKKESFFSLCPTELEKEKKATMPPHELREKWKNKDEKWKRQGEEATRLSAQVNAKTRANHRFLLNRTKIVVGWKTIGWEYSRSTADVKPGVRNAKVRKRPVFWKTKNHQQLLHQWESKVMMTSYQWKSWRKNNSLRKVMINKQ